MTITLSTLLKKKEKNEKITALTAYDFVTAQWVDQAEIDIVLVGDSLGNVVLGHPTTLAVTMKEMLHHLKAVVRAIHNSFLIVDMPFLSYGISTKKTLANAGKFLHFGAKAVKLEGASKAILRDIHALVSLGIPVCGHLGFTPQSVHQLGGYKIQGKTKEDAEEILSQAFCLEQAGASLIFLEMMPSALAKEITEKLSIPTIGIGAGKDCNGQILVVHDMLGASANSLPKFVKPYAQLNNIVTQALINYKNDVKSGSFPSSEYEY